ncbi:MAG: cupin-like domain-containing protein [Steroidobacter sp.]
MKPIQEWKNIDAATFRDEISSRNQPAVLRGLIKEWPATAAACKSERDFCDYLLPMDRRIPAEMFFGPSSIRGLFWYGPQMRGFNFERRPEQIGNALRLLLEHSNDSEPPAIYLGSVPIGQSMPQFAEENVVPILDQTIQPRIWIGNKVTVQTHFDHSENLACVVAGKRRFTLFPPEQLKNLYVGPLDFTMAGQPTSMVPLQNPDLEKYPNFKIALEAACSAELYPGDAIYIPYMWWHHVESLTPFNVLVNYWWDPAHPAAGAAFEALVHAIMSVKHLPPDKRMVWKGFFDHFVFEANGDPASHLALHEKGILHSMSPQLAVHIKNWLLRGLSR